MKRCVVKFGGSNFKNPSDMENIIKAVKLYKNPPVIVVSAFYGITNQLVEILESDRLNEKEINRIVDKLTNVKKNSLELHIDDSGVLKNIYSRLSERLNELTRILLGTHYIGEVPPFIKDKILSYGERLSSLIVSSILNYKGIKSVEKLPEDIGLISDGEPGNAAIDFKASEKSVKKLLDTDKVCVIPGFYGVSKEGRITLLGRGGSDYSAAAVARCVDADALDVWKDVNGYLSADPKIVENTVRIKRLGYSEAAELSYFGARILHPRTVEPLEDKSIPVRIFNIEDIKGNKLEPLSIIGPDSETEKGPKSVTFTKNFAVLTLSGAGVGIKPGILAKVTGALDESGINIKSVVTSQTSINIYLNREDLEPTEKVVRSLKLPSLTHIIPGKNLSVVALVGDGLGKAPEIAEGIIDALDSEGIHFSIFSVGASDAAAYAVIPEEQTEKAVRALHGRYF